MIARSRVSVVVLPSQYAAIDAIASAAGWLESNQPGHYSQRTALREAVARRIFERGLVEALSDPNWFAP